MSHDDFAFEPQRGLPERLPAGEHILWQGSPQPWRIAVEALSIKWIAGYFVLLAVWRVRRRPRRAGISPAFRSNPPRRAKSL